MTSARPRVALEAVGVRRRGRWILRDLDWAHAAGEIAWLTGDNGVGKSSLLRLLAGRARPTVGRVTREGGGEAPAAGPVRGRWYHPGMRLPPEATVADWRRLVDALTRGAPPLEPLLPAHADPGTRLGSLSTGEAKRLQLEAILRREAPFLVLDEPYSNLSPRGQEALTDVLVERARRAVVVVATNQAIPADIGGSRLVVERP